MVQISSFKFKMTKCFGILYRWLNPSRYTRPPKAVTEMMPRVTRSARPPKAVHRQSGGTESLDEFTYQPGCDELLEGQPSSSELLDHQPKHADLLKNQPTPGDLLHNISF